MRLLRVVEIENDGSTKEPVNYVCYHPIADAMLKEGHPHDLDGEPYKPSCCAVDFDGEYMQKLSWDEILNKLENLLRELNTYGLPPTYREEAKAILTVIGYEKPSEKEEGK